MLNQRDRRALQAGGGIIVGAVLLALVGLPAVRSFAAVRADVSDQRDLLRREHAVIARARATDSALTSARQRLGALAFVAFDGDEPALATRELASYVELMASVTGVAPLRTDPIGFESIAEGVSTVRIRVSGNAAYQQFMLLLHRVETSPQLMHVEQIAVRAADPARSAMADPALSFSMVVGAPAVINRGQLIASRGSTPARDSAQAVATEEEFLAVLETDPFHPNAVTADVVAMPVAAAPQAAIVLIGTVVLPGEKGFAMAKLGNESARIVRVGERLGVVKLIVVHRGAAEFEDENGVRTTVRVAKPGA